MYAVRKIHELAEATPEATALVVDLTPISYRAFWRMICAMRRSFAARGVAGAGVAVVWIDTLAIAWLADIALRTLGLTTLALRHEAELGGLSELDVRCVIVLEAENRPAIDHKLAPGARRISLHTEDWAFDASAPLEPPPEEPSGGHILLTSATTGRYKMVLFPSETEQGNREAGLLMYADSGARVTGGGENLAANVLNFGLWTAAGYNLPVLVWGLGGAVVVHQGADMHRSLTIPGLSHLLATPMHLMALLAAPEDAFERNDELQVITVGATPPLPQVMEIRRRLTGRIANALGSTETGAWTFTQVETADDLRWHRLHPNRVAEVVDEELRPLPPGELGEIRILINNGVTGYLNDPEATAAFFKDGYFYPGDLGVLDGAGRLELAGRVTDVLGVMGDKRPAAPLEAAMRDALGASAVCAFTEVDNEMAERLHVVIETAAPIDQARLQAAARAHVTDFPSVDFHFMAKLPRNDMGKVLRLKLKRQLAARADGR
jgi:acyl-CoA synthetase (AMP-forming)/AMP-acid ligase II